MLSTTTLPLHSLSLCSLSAVLTLAQHSIGRTNQRSSKTDQIGMAHSMVEEHRSRKIRHTNTIQIDFYLLEIIVAEIISAIVEVVNSVQTFSGIVLSNCGSDYSP